MRFLISNGKEKRFISSKDIKKICIKKNCLEITASCIKCAELKTIEFDELEQLGFIEYCKKLMKKVTK